jgi:hypothetical protein
LPLEGRGPWAPPAPPAWRIKRERWGWVDKNGGQRKGAADGGKERRCQGEEKQRRKRNGFLLRTYAQIQKIAGTFL